VIEVAIAMDPIPEAMAHGVLAQNTKEARRWRNESRAAQLRLMIAANTCLTTNNV
jgi:hypothetical protein